MLYHIVVACSDGTAFATRVRSAVPAVFPESYFHAGQPALRVTYENGSQWLENPYHIVADPEIISGTDLHPKVRLSAAALAALPHVVQVRS